MHHYKRDRAEKVWSSIKNYFLDLLIGILGELSDTSSLKFGAHCFIRCVTRLKYSSQWSLFSETSGRFMSKSLKI